MNRRVPALLLLAVTGCRPESPERAIQADLVIQPVVDSGFAAVADSEWVDVAGVTMIAFYPVRTNEQLEKDEGLATALDDLAYHIGTAMDSLQAAGATVHYRGGDTVFMRTRSARWRFVRPPDSADVGYVFADTARRMTALYGVRGYTDLVEYVHEFRTTGQIRPR